LFLVVLEEVTVDVLENQDLLVMFIEMVDKFTELRDLRKESIHQNFSLEDSLLCASFFDMIDFRGINFAVGVIFADHLIYGTLSTVSDLLIVNKLVLLFEE